MAKKNKTKKKTGKKLNDNTKNEPQRSRDVLQLLQIINCLFNYLYFTVDCSETLAAYT